MQAANLLSLSQLVSTFELLKKPLAPGGGNPSQAARTVVQGYFITISNAHNATLALRLEFTASAPNLTIADTIAIQDVSGENSFGDLVATADPNRFIYDLTLAPFDTGLVILQPDVTRANLGDVEVRGFVKISLRRGRGTFDVLITPEHRGTFLPANPASPSADFDQLVYALPTATGSSLFQLTPPPSMRDLVDNPQEKIIRDTVERSGQGKGIRDAVETFNPETLATATDGAIPENLQRILSLMADRIDTLQQVALQEAFITPQERPVVGNGVSANLS